MVRRHSVRIVVLMCVALANIAIARGDLVLDGSFESPALADGAFGNLPSSWGQYAGGAGGFYAWNPMDANIPASTYVSPSQPGTLPSPADGLQGAYAYVDPGKQNFAYQMLGDPTINTKYTLKFAAGLALSSESPEWDVYLMDAATMTQFYGHMNSADTGVNLPTAGTFVENSISWTNTTETTGGLCVFLSIKGHVGGAAIQELLIDNVRLTTAPVPEPCAISMVAIGLVGLLAYAWRKRK